MCSFYDPNGYLSSPQQESYCIVRAMDFVLKAVEWYEKDPGIFEETNSF
jgi:hypothetical protein